MATAYTGNSHLPWWALIVALVLAALIYPFVLVIYATTGFNVDVHQLAQMLGAALVPVGSYLYIYSGEHSELTISSSLGKSTS